MQILGKMLCVQIEKSMWGARKKLQASDIGVESSKLPPDALASLGSKRIFPKEPLQEGHALLKRVERKLLSMGTRFMGGYAIPLDRAQEISDFLQTAKLEFGRWRGSVIQHYESKLDEFMQAYPDWAPMIKPVLLSARDVERRFHFGYQIIKISVPEGLEEQSGLQEALDVIPRQVLKEVARTAQEILANVEGAEMSVRSLNALRAIYGKLVCMSFADRTLVEVAARVEATLNLSPKTGRIEGVYRERVINTLRELSDPDSPSHYPEVATPSLQLVASQATAATRAPLKRQRKGSFIDGYTASAG